MSEVQRYESLRNGAIGTVVSETETEVVLDFDGEQKTVKKSKLSTWYKPCSLTDEKELEEAKENGKKKAKIVDKVNKADKPNGDAPKKEDCSQLASKIISYLEKKGCLSKQTLSYIRIRLEGCKRNIMEIWYGKKLTGLKIVVRQEAVAGNKKLLELGTTVPPTHMYTLDHIYKFNNSSDIADIYAIIDLVVEYEKNYKPKTEPNKKKNGTGKINGKESLASKRKAQGIKSDDEKAAEAEKQEQEEQPIPETV